MKILETARNFREHSVMRILSPNLLLVTAFFVIQQPTPAPVSLIKENATVKISQHVYVIPDGNVGGVPNVGIVVGNKATLVIDTGLGPRNGQTVLREMGKVSKNADIYLVATHFHSEHVLGESAFPPSAKVIRARAEQQDIDEFGIQPNFATRSPLLAELMKDAQFRRADEIFDSEKILDLGGVRARLLWLGGGTHTNGDTLIFIEGDSVLFAGDVVMNRRFLAFASQRSSLQAWLNSLDKIEPLRPARIVPSHGEMGDGSLIEKNRTYLKALQTRVGELKRAGQSLEQVSEIVAAEFKSKYPDWTGNAGAAARSAYAETK
jgi:glyoxylase-like metal-dependent hydrolase (beta-lactamase superfamily II)